MRVLILKGNAPRHNHFANEIRKIDGVEALIIEHKRLSQKRLKKMLLKSPSTFFNRISKYFFMKLRQWNKKEQEFFKYPSCPIDHIGESLNSESSLQLMKDFNPDLLVAFGIPIISNKVIQIPQFGAINLHGGISPQYKGGNTIFWPLYKNDIGNAGATLHYMVKKVDSGKVIAKVYPAINAKDNELTVSAKTFKLATQEMVAIVKWVQFNKQKIGGEEQKGKGSLYLAKHRTFFIDLLGPRRVKKNLKKVSIEERIEKFY